MDAPVYCEYGCRYCSSNSGLHLQFLKQSLNRLFQVETSRDFDPHNAGDVLITYQNLVAQLERELGGYGPDVGQGKTLVYSQLTDGFSPVLLSSRTTHEILDLLVDRTRFRIRILTKNAIIGRPYWVNYFSRHSDRFVVGLSIGTLDADFARKVERRTSLPQSRIEALHNLQDAGVPTFGMLCPVFPQVLDSDELEHLIDQTRPHLCERIWAEPYSERDNWKHVRAVFAEGSPMWNWMTRAFEEGDTATWRRYASGLYSRIRDKAVGEGWADKLRYLLYEGDITSEDAAAFDGLDGVLLQSAANEEGRSKNPAFAAMQANS